MKRLIVVCGEAATGKTTWARGVARVLGAAVFDLDTVGGRLVEAAHHELGRDPADRDSPEYKRVFRDPLHETIFALARECEASAVLVAPFTRERRHPEFPTFLAEKVPTHAVHIHYFTAHGARRRELLRVRDAPRDRGKLEGSGDYRIEPEAEPPPPYPHEFFDTTLKFPGNAELHRLFSTPDAPI